MPLHCPCGKKQELALVTLMAQVVGRSAGDSSQAETRHLPQNQALGALM